MIEQAVFAVYVMNRILIASVLRRTSTAPFMHELFSVPHVRHRILFVLISPKTYIAPFMHESFPVHPCKETNV